MRWFKRLLARFRKPVVPSIDETGYVYQGVRVMPVDRSYKDGIPGGGRRVTPVTRQMVREMVIDRAPDEALFS